MVRQTNNQLKYIIFLNSWITYDSIIREFKYELNKVWTSINSLKTLQRIEKNVIKDNNEWNDELITWLVIYPKAKALKIHPCQ